MAVENIDNIGACAMEENTLAITENAEVTEISDVKRKMQFPGTVLKTTLAGALVDIGLVTPGVVHISQLQKEPVNKVEDVVQVGDSIDVWVRRVDKNKGRIELTMIEPLALEWREIKRNQVIKGKVQRIENFGVFVDIGAERPGLVHISEITHDYIRDPKEVVKEGDEVDVKVLGVDRRRKKIKLSMKALEDKPEKAVKKALKEDKKAAEKEESIPTAMEMAWRDAMERAQTQDDEEVKPQQKAIPQDNELDDLLARTLDHQVKTASE
jgi:small subunit ribosomal protein S1